MFSPLAVQSRSHAYGLFSCSVEIVTLATSTGLVTFFGVIAFSLGLGVIGLESMG